MHAKSRRGTAELMELLKNIALVIVSPRVGWDDVSQSSIPTDRVLSRAFYPLLAVLAVTSFVPMVYDSTLTLTQSIVRAVISFSSYFFTYFISSYLLSVFYPELVKTRLAQDRLSDYIIYNLIYLIILSIVANVLPIDFTPIFFMMLYLVWMAYRGVKTLGVKKGKVTKFVTIASCLFLGLPMAVKMLLGSIFN